MNAIREYRLKRRLSLTALGNMTGLSSATISKYEKSARPCGGRGHNYVAISKALNVPMSVLLGNSDNHTYRNQLQPIGKSRTENPDNCITVFRHRHGLTFKTLTEIMGFTSRECARRACGRATPLEKHIRAIAAYEGISAEEFKMKYSGEGASND